MDPSNSLRPASSSPRVRRTTVVIDMIAASTALNMRHFHAVRPPMVEMSWAGPAITVRLALEPKAFEMLARWALFANRLA